MTFTWWYQDADGDGHGAPATGQHTCDGPPGNDWVQLGDDCDDGDAENFPGNTEQCDGQDNDCDGTPDDGVTFTWWYQDADGDGHGAAATGQHTCDGPPGVDWVQLDDDCDDGDAGNFPGNTEQCDGQDNDCDNIADNGITFTTYYYDNDGDGHGNAGNSQSTCDGPPGANWVQLGDDCDDNAANRFPGNPESCDFVDNDCDGVVDDGFDNDGDGVTTCEGDCNDGNSAIYPGAPENCDSYDNDCDGQTDEGTGGAGCTWYHHDGDGDGYGEPGNLLCLCAAGSVADYDVQNDDDCNDGNAAIHPGVSDPCDGIDNDCDGGTDEDYLTNCSVAHGTPTCTAGSCAIGSCWSTWYDMVNGYADGCESQEDGYEVLQNGGDSCGNRIDLGAMPDYPASQQTVVGNIVPASDVDWYRFTFQDNGGDGPCDDLNIDISVSPGDFRFQVYDDSCDQYYTDYVGNDILCNGVLDHFEFNATGECGCTTGNGGCNADGKVIRVKVIRNTGGPDDGDYTLSVRNG